MLPARSVSCWPILASKCCCRDDCSSVSPVSGRPSIEAFTSSAEAFMPLARSLERKCELGHACGSNMPEPRRRVGSRGSPYGVVTRGGRAP
eukprot:5914318-Prymnesium_polylepis.2